MISKMAPPGRKCRKSLDIPPVDGKRVPNLDSSREKSWWIVRWGGAAVLCDRCKMLKTREYGWGGTPLAPRWEHPAGNFGGAGSQDDRVQVIAVQGDSHMVLGAAAEIAPYTFVPVVVRLDGSGNYDTNFSGNGWRTFPDPPGYVQRGTPSIALQRDGNIVVACLAVAIEPDDNDQIFNTRLLSSHVLFADGLESGTVSGWTTSVGD